MTVTLVIRLTCKIDGLLSLQIGEDLLFCVKKMKKKTTHAFNTGIERKRAFPTHHHIGLNLAFSFKYQVWPASLLRLIK